MQIPLFFLYCSLVKAHIPLKTKEFFQKSVLFVFLALNKKPSSNQLT